jgi:hypothetical protein
MHLLEQQVKYKIDVVHPEDELHDFNIENTV